MARSVGNGDGEQEQKNQLKPLTMIKILWPWEKQVSRSNGGTKNQKSKKQKKKKTQEKTNKKWL